MVTRSASWQVLPIHYAGWAHRFYLKKYVACSTLMGINVSLMFFLLQWLQVEIVMGLEEAFGISVEEESAQTIATVQDAADLIEKLVETNDA